MDFPRSAPHGSGPHADVLRRLNVSIRIHLGSFSARGFPDFSCHSSPVGIHLLLIHDFDDAWINSLHHHFVSLARFIWINAVRRLLTHVACQIEQRRLCGERHGTRREHPFAGSTGAVLGVLCVRSMRWHVLPCSGHAAWVSDFKRESRHCT